LNSQVVEPDTLVSPPIPPALQFQRDLIALIPHLRAFSRMLCGKREIAEDMAQDALTKAWRAHHRFEAGTNLKAWLFTILRNEYYSYLRRAWREAHWDEVVCEAIAAPPREQEWAMELLRHRASPWRTAARAAGGCHSGRGSRPKLRRCCASLRGPAGYHEKPRRARPRRADERPQWRKANPAAFCCAHNGHYRTHSVTTDRASRRRASYLCTAIRNRHPGGNKLAPGRHCAGDCREGRQNRRCAAPQRGL